MLIQRLVLLSFLAALPVWGAPLEIPEGIAASREAKEGWFQCWITEDREEFTSRWYKEGARKPAGEMATFYAKDKKACESLAAFIQARRTSTVWKRLSVADNGGGPASTSAQTFVHWQFNDSAVWDSTGFLYSGSSAVKLVQKEFQGRALPRSLAFRGGSH